MVSFSRIVGSRYTDLVVPQPVKGIIRGDDTGGNRLSMMGVTAIRLSLAASMLYAIKKTNPDKGRVSIAMSLLSTPAMGMSWGIQYLRDGAQIIKKGFLNRSIRDIGRGGLNWVGGCLILHLAQALEMGIFHKKCEGYRFGLVEVINYKMTKGTKYNGTSGY
ncbi:MAG: hypothetical protein KDK76_04885 [Chlamydiia bacterium]|nr:hypothetical protein [Chlamydiia bacterium]